MNPIIFCLHPLQDKQIEEYCFKQCGKLSLGILMDDICGNMYPCRHASCDFEERTMEWGTVDGAPCYLRKLVQ